MKDQRIPVLMDKETKRRLQALAESRQTTMGEQVRRLINSSYDRLSAAEMRKREVSA